MLTKHALEVIVPFITTYLCEAGLSSLLNILLRPLVHNCVHEIFVNFFCILLVPTDLQTFVHNCVQILFAYIPSNFSFIVRWKQREIFSLAYFK